MTPLLVRLALGPEPHGWIPIVVDQTTIRETPVLMAGVRVAQRVLPVAFVCYEYETLHKSQNVLEEALLLLIASCLPLGCKPVFIMDRGYARAALLRRLRGVNIPFIVRGQTQTMEVEASAATSGACRDGPGRRDAMGMLPTKTRCRNRWTSSSFTIDLVPIPALYGAFIVPAQSLAGHDRRGHVAAWSAPGGTDGCGGRSGDGARLRAVAVGQSDGFTRFSRHARHASRPRGNRVAPARADRTRSRARSRSRPPARGSAPRTARHRAP
jgi:hypothetical protein